MGSNKIKLPGQIEALSSWAQFLYALPLGWKIAASVLVVAVASAALASIWWPRATPAPDLSRPLTLTDMDLVLERRGAQVYLRRLQFKVRNTGSDMVAYRLTGFEAEGAPLDRWQVRDQDARHVPAGLSVDRWVEPGVEAVVPSRGMRYAVGIELTYDTLPQSGARKSYRKVLFEVEPYYGWTSSVPLITQRLMEDRER